jgi:hypothetical protein
LSLEILPLAITMMVGPQIMSAIILVTTERALRTSAAFVAGVAIATTLGVVVMRGLAALLGNSTSLGDPSDSDSAGEIVQIVLVGLLALAALKTYRGRETSEPPKWLGNLMSADAKKALRTGLLVILLMPSDIVVMLTVGVNLEHNGNSVLDALPFIGATALIAALPLLGYLLFHRRARAAMPALRDWINSNSWVVSIIAYAVFIVLIL